MLSDMRPRDEVRATIVEQLHTAYTEVKWARLELTWIA
jgi:hypothetical protein